MKRRTRLEEPSTVRKRQRNEVHDFFFPTIVGYVFLPHVLVFGEETVFKLIFCLSKTDRLRFVFTTLEVRKGMFCFDVLIYK